MQWWWALGYTLWAMLATMGIRFVGVVVTATWQGLSYPQAAMAVLRSPLFLGVSQLLGFGLAIAMLLRRFELSSKTVSGGVLALAALAGVAMQLPFAELGNVVTEWVGYDPAAASSLRQMLAPESFGGGFAVVFAFVVIAPLMEEALFRGILLPALSEVHGPRFALLLSSVLFSCVHLSAAGATFAFAAGLVLGALRIRTGSLLPCVVLHAAINAVPVLVPPAFVPIEGMNVIGDTLLHVPFHWLVGSSIVAVGAVVLLTKLHANQDSEADPSET